MPPSTSKARLAWRQCTAEASTNCERCCLADLLEEFNEIMVPINVETPSEAELRIAQAQLIGWLEGLFHGIQASLFTQQMAAQAQLQEMARRVSALTTRSPGRRAGLRAVPVPSLGVETLTSARVFERGLAAYLTAWRYRARRPGYLPPPIGEGTKATPS